MNRYYLNQLTKDELIDVFMDKNEKMLADKADNENTNNNNSNNNKSNNQKIILQKLEDNNEIVNNLREVNSAIKGFTTSYEIQLYYKDRIKDTHQNKDRKYVAPTILLKHLKKSRVYIKKIMIKTFIEI